MNTDELIKYWINTAEKDFTTMLHLYESEDYHWSLFMGHLVIEKLLKGLYISKIDNNPPGIHDLLRIVKQSKIELNEELEDSLDIITTFNISTRYPDYKESFYTQCTYEFTTSDINKIQELRKWILSLIEMK